MAKWQYRFKVKPDPHQLTALKRALKQRRFGIFFEQRVGKTKVAIDFCGVKHVSEGITKVLIVCPLSVRMEWAKQIEQHISPQVQYDVYLYPTADVYKYKEKRQEIRKATRKNTDKLIFLVMNYDALSSEEVEALNRWSPDVVIFDESHLIKRHNSNRSKFAYRIAKKAENVLLLTGTPIPKKIHDIFGQFRALNPEVFGSRWTDFKDRYCVMGGYMGKEIIDYTNKEELAKKIAMHSIRVKRKDVFSEPNVETVIVPVELERQARKVYDDLRQAYIAELEKESRVTADMAGVRAMRLQQICGGFIKDDDGNVKQVSKAKLNATVDLAQTHIEGGECVVIFHRFIEEGRALYDALFKKGYRVAAYNGSTTEQERERAKALFQDGQLDAIVVQISTGAMGVSFDRSHINIFYSPTYKLDDVLQAKDRVMGRNQKHDVTNYYMAVDKSVDYKIMETLAREEDLASSIADRWKWVMKD